MYFVVIYAFFGENFILQEFCLCKKNDKYEVCAPYGTKYVILSSHDKMSRRLARESVATVA